LGADFILSDDSPLLNLFHPFLLIREGVRLGLFKQTTGSLRLRGTEARIETREARIGS
jgi:hypothetical protein